MIPDSAWGALPHHPGPNRLLLLLWQFSGWKPGGDPAFAWPSVDTIACRLRLRARTVREGLEKLCELGYIRAAVECRIANGRRDEREGWRLFEDPKDAAAFDLEAAAQAQLDLFAGSSAPVDNSVDGEAAATDGAAQVRQKSAQVRTDGGAGAPEIGAGAHHSKEGAGVELVSELVVSVGPPEHDDDATKIWTLYEEFRVRMLGGVLRDGPPPASLRSLIGLHGATKVEAYALLSLKYAAAARDRNRDCWRDRVAERSDGREWHPARFEAVARWREPDDPAPALPRPPPADPEVDGERVTRFERDAWERGGADAVRELRAAPTLTAEAAARMLRDDAPWLRIAGEGGT